MIIRSSSKRRAKLNPTTLRASRRTDPTGRGGGSIERAWAEIIRDAARGALGDAAEKKEEPAAEGVGLGAASGGHCTGVLARGGALPCVHSARTEGNGEQIQQ